MRAFLRSLIGNFVGCFRMRMVPWHVLAIVLTYVLVATGTDWRYFLAAQGPAVRTWLFPAVILGSLLPFVVPLVLGTVGWVRSHVRMRRDALALAQAALLGSAVSSLYKALTGRVHPPHMLTDVLPVDSSNLWRFGILRGGVFWGWPSSHTTIAFAMAVTVCVLYPTRRLLVGAVLLYAVYVGLGVSTGIHWLSEVVAGIVYGSIVGVTVGMYFRHRRAAA